MTQSFSTWAQRAAVLGLAIFSLQATASIARADITVCNHYTKTISYTETIPRSTCSNGWAEHGWWVLAPGACVKILVGNAGAVRPFFYYWAFATDGVHWDGGAGPWYEPLSGHDDCYANFQLSCTNAGANCVSAKHNTINLNPASNSLTITFSK